MFWRFKCELSILNFVVPFKLQYRLIARASVLLGWSSILVFYAGVKEPK
mgnify:FL=1